MKCGGAVFSDGSPVFCGKRHFHQRREAADENRSYAGRGPDSHPAEPSPAGHADAASGAGPGGPLSPLGTEILPLERALGRTLAADVAAPLDQPPFDRSPLDGYALRSADLAGADRDHPAVLEVVDTVYAGDEARIPVGPGQAVRIMTGAMLPPGCDCVVPQEDTDRGAAATVWYPRRTPTGGTRSPCSSP